MSILSSMKTNENTNLETIVLINEEEIEEMPIIKDIIVKIQENKFEKESEQQIKPVKAIQAITRLDSVLGYIEQSEPSIEINIKVFC
ncbi:18764_t:CDS:2 [Dentiscutata erythropus]|uniref:18764_t:CDS:1 n=1 Tax=Dentiscutata erythropus TaxID=1348616 RepID=A0A9N8V7T4_9GLOM|nr:18764_t:CDS:2 [Dentiscutata erythropus]